MSSPYLAKLSKEDRTILENQLWDQQLGKCFISGLDMELGLDELDIDHIIPSRDNGKDEPSNFALTLAKYNRDRKSTRLNSSHDQMS